MNAHLGCLVDDLPHCHLVSWSDARLTRLLLGALSELEELRVDNIGFGVIFALRWVRVRARARFKCKKARGAWVEFARVTQTDATRTASTSFASAVRMY